MTWEQFGDIALDSLLDSLKILAVAFVFYFVLSFFESRIASLLEKKKKYAPLFGSVAGVIPQCGISVVASDLYSQSHITLGTLVAIFVACSDEALPIMFGDFTGRWYMAFPLIGIKMLGGALFGYLIDLMYKKGERAVEGHLETCEGNRTVHTGCCGHEIDEGGEESPLHEHLIHPLTHSLKIFAYAFVISLLFGVFITWLNDTYDLSAFLSSSYWFAPLFAIVIGLIPNCASSVLITELYVGGAIPFGALVAGLAVNAGLGPLYLLKRKNTLKKALLIEGLLIVIALILGYSFMWVKI